MISERHSDEVIRLSESYYEESEESTDIIDNIPVNSDVYVAKDGAKWIPHNKAGTTLSRYYLRRGEISGINVFIGYIVRASNKEPEKKVKLKTKIENSSTFESDPDFVKTLIQNCIDERVSQNEREETATHIGIREAEDWFRPIDLAKECDIYISSRSGSHKEIPITYGYTQDLFKNRSQNFKPKIKENYPQYLENSPLVSMEVPLRDSVRSEWPLWHAAKSKAVFARRRSKSKPKQKLLDIRAELERERRTREVREQALPSEYHRQTYL
ncbi:hypothetical protein TNCV_796141 [Trichonephila clavipes]|nr:hypothetical protein TNCV_796141 [Trichonephila clavipes]